MYDGTPEQSRANYAPTKLHRNDACRGRILHIQPNSPAEIAGLQIGDEILNANGVVLHDALEWSWYADGSSVEIGVMSSGEPERYVTLTRDFGESWGIEFDETLFDGVRTCKNACVFCFMTMLPKGMREPLYLRDDDFRLSFLQGNFVTLTNVSDDDVDRILEQNLSPLHVSVHSLEEASRRKLIGINHARGVEVLQELLDNDIEIHAQIVLVPGVNDGEVLRETLEALLAHEGVLSIGVVPLGYTQYQKKFSSSYDDPSRAQVILDMVAPLQSQQFEQLGYSRLQLADEFYLNAGVELPQAEFYGGYPQYEDGIGMVRAFLDEAKEGMSLLSKTVESKQEALTSSPVAFFTGESFAPILRSSLSPFSENLISVVEVKNHFFGGNVSVTGLLTGEDIIGSAQKLAKHTTVAIPDVVFNADGLTLDGYTVAKLREVISQPLRVVSCTFEGIVEVITDF